MPNLSHIVRPSEGGMPLLDFLTARLRLSRRRAKALLDARSVWVNRRRVWMARHALAPRDVVEVLAAPAPKGTEQLEIPVLYEDEDLLIINKPAGWLANGPHSVEETLIRRRGNPRLRAAHRLDRDTSGCMLLVKNDGAFDQAAALLRDRRMLKLYRAIVAGCLRTEGMVIRQPLDGQSAVTKIRTLDANRLATHLAVSLETGRTHQIRRHLAARHHPVLGDRQYGGELLAGDTYRLVPRQMLHARTIEFRWPRTDREVRVEAPLPADFRACLKTFRLV